MATKKSKKKGRAAANQKISELFVRRRIQNWLFDHGFGHNFRERETHEHGVDIKVQDNGPYHSQYFYVEVKGASSSHYHHSADDAAFVGVLGQIITRMTVIAPNAYHYGIGLPESCAKIAMRRLPWQITKHLLLHIFSVDGTGAVKHYTWQDLKKRQQARLFQ